MLAVMKKKALEAVKRELNGNDANGSNGEINGPSGGTAKIEKASSNDDGTLMTFEPIEGKPMYNAILSTLITVLKPASITLTDNSHQHAGHAGNKGWEGSGESHFALEIVAEAFEGLSLVKRHQLIYMLLGEVMQKIHALQISAKSLSEVGREEQK